MKLVWTLIVLSLFVSCQPFEVEIQELDLKVMVLKQHEEIQELQSIVLKLSQEIKTLKAIQV